jgi:tRNA pseudouridine synthase 10
VGLEDLQKARRIIERYPLCDACLGRLLRPRGGAREDKERGSEVKSLILSETKHLLNGPRRGEALPILRNLARSGDLEALQLAELLAAPIDKSAQCTVCLGKFTDEVLEKVAAKAAESSSIYELDNFLVGAHVPGHIASIEERIISEMALTDAETLRKEICREVGRRLETLLGKPVNFASPDILFKVDIFTGEAEVKPAPLYISGRYLKNQPNIPQTPWYCSRCWGGGCEICGFTGRNYPDSVAEYVAGPAMKLSGALGYKFHAAGREDVDVEVKGLGRPFILELIQPRRRGIDLELLKRQIAEFSGGKVEVDDLAPARRSYLKLLKSEVEGAVKQYRAVVRFESPVTIDGLKLLETRLDGAVISQMTPTRVLKRRGERLRKRRIHRVAALQTDPYTAEFLIISDGGLYVKELIHGDGGRTRPSFSEIVANRPVEIRLEFLGISRPVPQKKADDSAT